MPQRLEGDLPIEWSRAEANQDPVSVRFWKESNCRDFPLWKEKHWLLWAHSKS